MDIVPASETPAGRMAAGHFYTDVPNTAITVHLREGLKLVFGLYALAVQIEQVLCIALDFSLYLFSPFILWHYCKFTRYI